MDKEQIGVAIDTETTGFKAGTHEIVSVAFIAHDEEFNIIHTFKTKIRPMRPELAHPKALEVNQLSLTDLKTAPTPQQIRNAFFQWHEEVLENKMIVALGHNFAFDQRFLIVFFAAFYDNIFYYKFRDTFVLAKGLQDSGLLEKEQSLSLTNLCEKFHIPHKTHDAFGDAKATLQLYKKLIMLARR